MPWVGDVGEEIEGLFGDLDSYVMPSDLHSAWVSDVPAKVVPFVPYGRSRIGCRICGEPCSIVGKRWPHRRCLACKPFKRRYDPVSFPCGHPRVASNTQVFRATETRCKTCNRAAARKAYHAKPKAPKMTTAARHAVKFGHPYTPRGRVGHIVCATCAARYWRREKEPHANSLG